jgi:hypothetical protein
LKQQYVENYLPALSILSSQNSTASKENHSELQTLIEKEIFTSQQSEKKSPGEINWKNENEWKIRLFEEIKSWDTERTKEFNLKIKKRIQEKQLEEKKQLEEERSEEEQERKRLKEEQERKRIQESKKKDVSMYFKNIHTIKKIIYSIIILVLLIVLMNKLKEKIGSL